MRYYLNYYGGYCELSEKGCVSILGKSFSRLSEMCVKDGAAWAPVNGNSEIWIQFISIACNFR